jgi:amino acid adenylation domain-containing protein
LKKQSFEQCIHRLFETRAEVAPQAIAAIFKQEKLSYESLNRRANQLAHYLRRLGVGPEVIVGLDSERSLEMLIGMLAVLKAGGAYVPLSTQYSPSRLSQIFSETQAQILLTREQSRWQLPNTGILLFRLDADWQLISPERDKNPDNVTEIDNLAYVTYTSGTTGTPKGVLITHRGLTNHSLDVGLRYELRPDDRVLQFASLTFDVAAEEIFPTLASGAAVVLRTDEMLSARFGTTAEAMGITVLNLPASYWREWVDQLFADDRVPSSLRLLVVGSEKVPGATFSTWRKIAGDAIRCFNAYGLTETTITSTVHDPNLSGAGVEEQDCLPIGRPISNTQLYVLDDVLQPVDVGTTGQLYVGGAGLARGYLALPAVTAEKFIPDTFSAEPGARLYKTGDRARFMPDGNLEFLGRLDRQVKVRGFRVELREIESVLARHPALATAVVTANDDSSGNTRLIAYVMSTPGVSPDNGSGTIESEQLSQWQKVHDDEVFNQTSPQDPTLNTSGWNSSYDGLPIPEEELREWVSDSVERILSLRPDRILEIGCGTGMLLFKLAPRCSRFIGTDFSGAALNYIRTQLQERPLDHVTLLERTADNFEGIEENSFDAVVLNSVIQYFPTADYLVRVLEGAARVVAPGGFIFIGDIRSLPMLEPFVASVELQKAGPQLTTEQLRQRVRMRVTQEEELVINPRFFFALKRRLPKISHVEIMPRRALHLNEMSKFRYQAIIRVGTSTPLAAVDEWLDWNDQHLTLDEVRKLLVERQPEALGITSVPNARITKDVKLIEWLNSSECPATAEELRERLLRLEETGVYPDAFWALKDEVPYDVELSFARHAADGRYDVSFRRRASADRREHAREAFPYPSADGEPRRYTNNPLLDKQARQIVPELMSFAKAQLPAYMVPSTFVLLDRLPLTTNGKIDYAALPIPESPRSETAGELSPPRTRTERLLAAAWEEVLDVERVGFNDNFFDCGGHSLRALRVLSRVRQCLKIELSLTDVFTTPTVAGLAELIEHKQLELMSENDANRLHAELKQLSEEATNSTLLAKNEGIVLSQAHMERFPSLSPAKLRLLILRWGEQLSATEDPASLTSGVPSLKCVARSGSPLPLSFAQETVWHRHQSETIRPPAIPVAWRLEGPLDSAALKRALDEVMNRHEILRMRFVAGAGQVRACVGQVPEPVESFQLAYVDLRDLPVEERQARMEQAREAEFYEGFDLERGPIFRGRLLRLDEEEHVLLLTLHALVGDAASVGVLKAEIAMLYQSFVIGQPFPLPELPVQYADYAAWQREWLQGEPLEEQVSYWRKHLGESPPVLEFPADKTLPADGRYLGPDHRYPVGEEPMTLAADLVERLNALSRRENVTLYMILLAAFKALLFRYTQQSSIVVATPVSGRTRKETERLIGLFVNNVAIRSDLSGDQSFRALLGQVKESTMGAFAHQDLPFEKLVDELRLAPSRSHIPLFQCMFILQNARAAALRASKGIDLKLSSIYSEGKLTRYDLSVTVVEFPGDYNGWIQYRSDLFHAATIIQLADNYRALLADVAANPELHLAELLPTLKTTRDTSAYK